MKHKSDDYKLNDVDYYLTEDKSQEEACKIFKCSPRKGNLKIIRSEIIGIKNEKGVKRAIILCLYE